MSEQTSYSSQSYSSQSPSSSSPSSTLSPFFSHLSAYSLFRLRFSVRCFVTSLRKRKLPLKEGDEKNGKGVFIRESSLNLERSHSSKDAKVSGDLDIPALVKQISGGGATKRERETDVVGMGVGYPSDEIMHTRSTDTVVVTTPTVVVMKGPSLAPVDVKSLISHPPSSYVQHRTPSGISYFMLSHPCDYLEIRLLVSCGSVDETEEESGIAHVIEHMAFRGTQRCENRDDIEERMGKVGVKMISHANAATNWENTEYYLRIPVTMLAHTWKLRQQEKEKPRKTKATRSERKDGKGSKSKPSTKKEPKSRFPPSSPSSTLSLTIHVDAVTAVATVDFKEVKKEEGEDDDDNEAGDVEEKNKDKNSSPAPSSSTESLVPFYDELYTNIDRLFEWFIDIMENISFSPQLVKDELNVIREESELRKLSSMYNALIVKDTLYEGKEPIGKAEGVHFASPKILTEFYKKHYKLNRMNFSIKGAIQWDRMNSLVKKHIEGYKSTHSNGHAHNIERSIKFPLSLHYDPLPSNTNFPVIEVATTVPESFFLISFRLRYYTEAASTLEEFLDPYTSTLLPGTIPLMSRFLLEWFKMTTPPCAAWNRLAAPNPTPLAMEAIQVDFVQNRREVVGAFGVYDTKSPLYTEHKKYAEGVRKKYESLYGIKSQDAVDFLLHFRNLLIDCKAMQHLLKLCVEMEERKEKEHEADGSKDKEEGDKKEEDKEFTQASKSNSGTNDISLRTLFTSLDFQYYDAMDKLDPFNDLTFLQNLQNFVNGYVPLVYNAVALSKYQERTMNVSMAKSLLYKWDKIFNDANWKIICLIPSGSDIQSFYQVKISIMSIYKEVIHGMSHAECYQWSELRMKMRISYDKQEQDVLNTQIHKYLSPIPPLSKDKIESDGLIISDPSLHPLVVTKTAGGPLLTSYKLIGGGILTIQFIESKVQATAKASSTSPDQVAVKDDYISIVIKNFVRNSCQFYDAHHGNKNQLPPVDRDTLAFAPDAKIPDPSDLCTQCADSLLVASLLHLKDLHGFGFPHQEDTKEYKEKNDNNGIMKSAAGLLFLAQSTVSVDLFQLLSHIFQASFSVADLGRLQQLLLLIYQLFHRGLAMATEKRSLMIEKGIIDEKGSPMKLSKKEFDKKSAEVLSILKTKYATPHDYINSYRNLLKTDPAYKSLFTKTSSVSPLRPQESKLPCTMDPSLPIHTMSSFLQHNDAYLYCCHPLLYPAKNFDTVSNDLIQEAELEILQLFTSINEFDIFLQIPVSLRFQLETPWVPQGADPSEHKSATLLDKYTLDMLTFIDRIPVPMLPSLLPPPPPAAIQTKVSTELSSYGILAIGKGWNARCYEMVNSDQCMMIISFYSLYGPPFISPLIELLYQRIYSVLRHQLAAIYSLQVDTDPHLKLYIQIHIACERKLFESVASCVLEIIDDLQGIIRPVTHSAGYVDHFEGKWKKRGRPTAEELKKFDDQFFLKGQFVTAVIEGGGVYKPYQTLNTSAVLSILWPAIDSVPQTANGTTSPVGDLKKKKAEKEKEKSNVVKSPFPWRDFWLLTAFVAPFFVGGFVLGLLAPNNWRENVRGKLLFLGRLPGNNARK